MTFFATGFSQNIYETLQLIFFGLALNENSQQKTLTVIPYSKVKQKSRENNRSIKTKNAPTERFSSHYRVFNT